MSPVIEPMRKTDLLSGNVGYDRRLFICFDSLRELRAFKPASSKNDWHDVYSPFFICFGVFLYINLFLSDINSMYLKHMNSQCFRHSLVFLG